MRMGTAFVVAACLGACSGSGGGGRDTAVGTDSDTGLTSASASGSASATASGTDSATASGTTTTGGTDSASAGTASATGGATATGGPTTTDGSTSGDCYPFCPDMGVPPKMDVPAETCGESNYKLETVAPNVLLVLDASGSMVNTALYWDHDDNAGTPTVSRWYSLWEVVNFIADTFDLSMNLGMQFYPQLGDPFDCAIGTPPEVPVGPMKGMDIKTALPPQNEYTQIWTNPTPTCDALNLGYTHLKTLDPNIPAAVILITDGVPSNATCPPNNTYPTCIQWAGDAFNVDDITTYLVGIDIGAGTVPDFNDLAVAGGAPKNDPNEKFYNSKNQIELQAALEQIAGQVISCVAPLDPVPDDPTMVQVQLDGNIVPPVMDCANQDGWVYVNPNGPYDAIELCGSYCDDFKANNGEIKALYGCPPEG